MPKTKDHKSFIETQVAEYTDELINDALECGNDPLQIAKRIAEEIKRGYLQAMRQHFYFEEGCDFFNQNETADD